MKCNMGTTDRYIRATAGIMFAIYAGMKLDPIIAIPSIIIAYTVVTRWCLLYHMMGINTGCHQVEGNSVKSGRNNIFEGLSVSLLFLLVLLIIYLIIRYINL